MVRMEYTKPQLIDFSGNIWKRYEKIITQSNIFKWELLSVQAGYNQQCRVGQRMRELVLDNHVPAFYTSLYWQDTSMQH